MTEAQPPGGSPGRPAPSAPDEASADRPPPRPGSSRLGRARKVWLSPGGISAIAAALAVVLTAIGLYVQSRPAGAPAAVSPGAGAGSTAPTEPALFVYGSSMPGMSRHDVISRFVVRSARDSVPGTLYDSGLGYPMAKFGTGDVVRGVVLWLDPATAAEAMAEMTRVEAGLFHPVPVRTATGVSAQAYEWIGATDGYPRIDAWDGSTAGYGQRVGWPELQAGDCFQADDDVSMLTSWCAAPHALEAYATGVVRTRGDVRSAAETQCDQAFEPFIGRARAESQLLVRVYAESRSQTDAPRYLCAVGIEGSTHAGSLRGADR